MKALTERARAGVEVRLLVDGSEVVDSPNIFMMNLLLPEESMQSFSPTWFPILTSGSISATTGKLRSLTVRLHLSVALTLWWLSRAGQTLGDTGRDAAVRIKGTGALVAQMRFYLDWNFRIKGNSGSSGTLIPPESLPIFYNQIVSGGPDTKWNPVKGILPSISIRATESVYIQTPYFIPDQV